MLRRLYPQADIHRALKAVEMALSSPLLDDIELRGARGLLVNVTCDDSLTMEEYSLINERVHEIASEEADAKCGMSVNPNLNGELRVTVVATGLNGHKTTVQVTAPVAQPINPKVASFIRPEMPVAQPASPRRMDLDQPAYGRARPAAVGSAAAYLQELDEDIINIPAFLRHQAD